MSSSKSICVFSTPFLLIDSSPKGQQEFLDLAHGFHDDLARFELELYSNDKGTFIFDHVDSMDAYESLNLALSEFAKSISPLLGSSFKFTVRDLDSGEDERDDVIYAGPSPESIERFKKQEAIAGAIDTFKKSGVAGLKKYITLLESSINDELQDFVVEIVEQGGSDVVQFECQAEDETHAREKVSLAHPDVSIVNVFLKSAEFDSPDEDADELVKNDDRASIELYLRVDYKLNGESPECMKENLERVVNRAIGDGLLTGNSAAEVESFKDGVEILSNLTEDELTDFMYDRIENGQLEMEDIPRRLARYGLMTPAAFVSEMDERMQDVEFGRYSENENEARQSNPLSYGEGAGV